MNIEFDQTDCWVLLSIPTTNQGGGLTEIIGLADMLNHSIPTSLEIEVAITKGIQAEVLSLNNNHFVLSTSFRTLIEQLKNGKGGRFTLIDKLNKKLSSQGFEQKNIETFELSKSEHETAYNNYIDCFHNVSNERNKSV